MKVDKLNPIVGKDCKYFDSLSAKERNVFERMIVDHKKAKLSYLDKLLNDKIEFESLLRTIIK